MLSTQETPAENKLDFLQRQSWQLELIITGFALAGMISGADKFYELILFSSKHLQPNRLYRPCGFFHSVGCQPSLLCHHSTLFHECRTPLPVDRGTGPTRCNE
jgi:hypothetical protein